MTAPSSAGNVDGGSACALPRWDAPAHTRNPDGCFDRCKETSAAYTAFLREHGIDAEWVQVVGPRRNYPNAVEQWRRVPRQRWQHYLTRVPGPTGPDSDYYVDYTARQFDPDTDHPQTTRVADADWAETYPLPAAVLDRYLRTAPHTPTIRGGHHP